MVLRDQKNDQADVPRHALISGLSLGAATAALLNSISGPSINNAFASEVSRAMDTHHNAMVVPQVMPPLLLANANRAQNMVLAHRSHRSHSSHRAHYSSRGSGGSRGGIPPIVLIGAVAAAGVGGYWLATQKKDKEK